MKAQFRLGWHHMKMKEEKVLTVTLTMITKDVFEHSQIRAKFTTEPAGRLQTHGFHATMKDRVPLYLNSNYYSMGLYIILNKTKADVTSLTRRTVGRYSQTVSRQRSDSENLL